MTEEIISLYTRLRDPTCQDAGDITNALMDFYHNPESFDVLFEIINTSHEETICKYAVVGLEKVINFNSDSIPAFYEKLLQLSVYERFSEIRRLNMKYVQKCLNLNLIQVVDGFINEIAQNMTPLHAATICNLLTICMNYEYQNAAQQAAVDVCFQSTDPEIKFAAINLVFHQCNLSDDEEPSELAINCFNEAISLLNVCAKNPQYLLVVKSLVSDCLCFSIQNESNFLNYETILQTATDIFGNSSLQREVRIEARKLIDEVATAQESAILGEEFGEGTLGYNLFLLYVQFVTETLNAEDIFTKANNDMETITAVLSKDNNFCEALLTFISQCEDESQLYSFLCSLVVALENNENYFQDKIESIEELLSTVIQNENVCIITVSLVCVRTLANFYGKDIGQQTGSLIPLILQQYTENENGITSEYFKALKSLLTNYTDTDEIFDDIANVIIQTLEAGIYNISCLKSLAVLIKNSNEKSGEHIEELYALLNTIIDNTENEDLSILKPTAIDCLSYLAEKNPEAFSGLVDEFSDKLIQLFQDDYLQTECIKALGRMIETYTEHFNEKVDQWIPTLLEVGKQDLTPNKGEGEFMDDEDLAEDDAYNALLKKVSSSLRVLCIILRHYPPKIPQLTDEVFDCFRNIANVSITQKCMLDFADSAIYFIQGLAQLGEKSEHMATAQKLLEIVTSTLPCLVDNQAIGKALEAVTEIICEFTVQILLENESMRSSVLETVEKALEYDEQYIETLHMNASLFLRELMDQMHDDAWDLISPFIQYYQELEESDNAEFNNLIIQFYGDLCGNCPAHVPDEFVTKTIEYSLPSVINQNSTIALAALKQIATSKAAALEPHAQQIVDYIIHRLQIVDNKTEEIQSLQDNCVSLLGKLIINLIGDGFPLQEYIGLITAAMPAQMEVEENPSILEFFFYIVEKVGQNFPQEICGVLCRIFSDSEDDLLGWFFTPENIDQLKSLLHQYIQKVGNPGDFIAKITNGDENKAANIQAALEIY